MNKFTLCPTHEGLLQIYCIPCKEFLCLECLSTHDNDGKDHKYQHILSFAKEKILPNLEKLSEEMTKEDYKPEEGKEKLINSVSEIYDKIQELSTLHSSTALKLQAMSKRLESILGPVKHRPYSELMRAGITRDKNKLEQAIKEGNSENLLKVTLKIEEEAKVSKENNIEKSVLPKMKEDVKKIPYLKDYKALSEALKGLVSRCHTFGLDFCISGWKLDRNYFIGKMTLSEDCLVYGNSASNGYPALIADTAIDSGYMIYEVNVQSLNCVGCEGFGVIELERYKQIVSNNPETHEAYNEMIGIFHGSSSKGLKKSSPLNLQSQGRYMVLLDMNEAKISIKGDFINY